MKSVTVPHFVYSEFSILSRVIKNKRRKKTQEVQEWLAAKLGLNHLKNAQAKFTAAGDEGLTVHVPEDLWNEFGPDFVQVCKGLQGVMMDDLPLSAVMQQIRRDLGRLTAKGEWHYDSGNREVETKADRTPIADAPHHFGEFIADAPEYLETLLMVMDGLTGKSGARVPIGAISHIRQAFSSLESAEWFFDREAWQVKTASGAEVADLSALDFVAEDYEYNITRQWTGHGSEADGRFIAASPARIGRLLREIDALDKGGSALEYSGSSESHVPARNPMPEWFLKLAESKVHEPLVTRAELEKLTSARTGGILLNAFSQFFEEGPAAITAVQKVPASESETAVNELAEAVWNFHEGRWLYQPEMKVVRDFLSVLERDVRLMVRSYPHRSLSKVLLELRQKDELQEYHDSAVSRRTVRIGQREISVLTIPEDPWAGREVDLWLHGSEFGTVVVHILKT